MYITHTIRGAQFVQTNCSSQLKISWRMIGKSPDVIKPKSGKGSCSSSLPWKLVLMFTLKWKIFNYFACSQLFYFPALSLITRWTECKAGPIIDVCCQARSLSKMVSITLIINKAENVGCFRPIK